MIMGVMWMIGWWAMGLVQDIFYLHVLHASMVMYVDLRVKDLGAWMCISGVYWRSCTCTMY